jgi:hypothetical protein
MTVLVLTHTRDLAADLVVLELQRRRLVYRRLNIDAFPGALEICYDPAASAATFDAAGRRFSAEDVRAVWCRRAHRPGHSQDYAEREADAFFRGLWPEMTWAWVNDPAAAARADSKLWQLRAASGAGFRVPATLVGNQVAQVRDMFGPGPVIVKTIAGAAIDRHGVREHLYSQLVDVAELDAAAVRAAPCIFQENAKPGTDVRVTVAGDQVFGTDINAPGGAVDWRACPAEAVTYRRVDLPDELAMRCRDICRLAGLAYAAFDFVRQPDGGYVFLEINPSGQWGWIERATGQPVTRAIVDVLAAHQGGT